MFDNHFVDVTDVVATAVTIVVDSVGPPGGGSVSYRDFNNTKPREFDRTRGLIVAMIWISNVEGCFYTWACLDS